MTQQKPKLTARERVFVPLFCSMLAILIVVVIVCSWSLPSRLGPSSASSSNSDHGAAPSAPKALSGSVEIFFLVNDSRSMSSVQLSRSTFGKIVALLAPHSPLDAKFNLPMDQQILEDAAAWPSFLIGMESERFLPEESFMEAFCDGIRRFEESPSADIAASCFNIYNQRNERVSFEIRPLLLISEAEDACEVIGKGAYGHCVRLNIDGTDYALKRSENADSLVNEFYYSRKFTLADGVVPAKAIVLGGGLQVVGVLYPLCRGETINKYIERMRLSEGMPEILWTLFLKILKIVEALQSKQVRHLDMKAENFMVSEAKDQSADVYLVDFGIASSDNDMDFRVDYFRHFRQTFNNAPEMSVYRHGMKYDTVDLFAIAGTLIETVEQYLDASVSQPLVVLLKQLMIPDLKYRLCDIAIIRRLAAKFRSFKKIEEVVFKGSNEGVYTECSNCKEISKFNTGDGVYVSIVALEKRARAAKFTAFNRQDNSVAYTCNITRGSPSILRAAAIPNFQEFGLCSSINNFRDEQMNECMLFPISGGVPITGHLWHISDLSLLIPFALNSTQELKTLFTNYGN